MSVMAVRLLVCVLMNPKSSPKKGVGSSNIKMSEHFSARLVKNLFIVDVAIVTVFLANGYALVEAGFDRVMGPYTLHVVLQHLISIFS